MNKRFSDRARGESNDQARCIHRSVGNAKSFNASFSTAGCRTQVNEEDLIVPVVDDFTEQSTESCKLDRIQLAFEDRILKMITPVTKSSKDLAKAFIVANVVTDQVSRSHLLSPLSIATQWSNGSIAYGRKSASCREKLSDLFETTSSHHDCKKNLTHLANTEAACTFVRRA